MNTELKRIREQQRETWTKYSRGWKKWDGFTMEWLKPMRDAIIYSLELTDSDLVLDVAAGTGEPGLTIAGHLPNGKVVITDLSESMLEVAKENAARKGVTNYETVACDVTELPFSDSNFHAVSCRFGFMFFPDMMLAAKEMFRVLKPRGRLASAVWGLPEKNIWISAILDTINKNMNLPGPQPGAPGIFRCGQPGLLVQLFRAAGFKNVYEKEISGKLHCITYDHYWNVMAEVAGPVITAMNKADHAMKEKIKREVFEIMDEKYPDGEASFDYSAIIIHGEK